MRALGPVVSTLLHWGPVVLVGTLLPHLTVSHSSRSPPPGNASRRANTLKIVTHIVLFAGAVVAMRMDALDTLLDPNPPAVTDEREAA